MRGVGRQMEAFKEGFNSVYPLSSLQGLICPGEVCVGWVGGMGERVERWGGKGRMYEKREEQTNLGRQKFFEEREGTN